MTLLDTMFGRRCRLCGVRRVAPIGPVAPTHPGNFQTKNFTLQHCRNCDVVYLDPLPQPADLKLLYEDSVQFVSANYTASDRVAQMMRYYSNAIRSFDLLPKAAPILEIGAGLAWVARACKAMDPHITTIAQDVSAECVRACPWVDRYFVGTLDDLPERGPFGLVSLTHVIEHVMDPAEMLRTMSMVVAPRGKVFITAPFRPSSWSNNRHIDAWRDYSYLHVPAHISYLSRRWFEMHARPKFEIAHWDASHENGQVFELVLQRI